MIVCQTTDLVGGRFRFLVNFGSINLIRINLKKIVFLVE